MGDYFRYRPLPGITASPPTPGWGGVAAETPHASAEGNPYKKQSLFPPTPFPIDSKVGSLQELPNVVWHPPPLPRSLAFKYHGTPNRHSPFPPFSPLGISTFSSLDTACVPAVLSFSFLPLSSSTRAPALPHGPNPDSQVGQPPHEHPPLFSMGTAWCQRCQGQKCPGFGGPCHPTWVAPHMAASPLMLRPVWTYM